MLTQARLKELLHYEPETGIFTRRVQTNNRCEVGKVAGYTHIKTGYVMVSVDSKDYRAHRLAFLYMDGYFPEHDVDHERGIRHDNRWSEIRHATRGCNMQNLKVYSNNKSGFPGVYWDTRNNVWASGLSVVGKRLYLGGHHAALEAALARLTEEIWNENYHCNLRGNLVKAIQEAWPEFNTKCLS